MPRWLCRSVVAVLEQVVEPGENWVDETYLDRPFELPMTWVDEVPHKVRGSDHCTHAPALWPFSNACHNVASTPQGVLTTTYYSGPNSKWADKSLRDELCKSVLLVSQFGRRRLRCMAATMRTAWCNHVPRAQSWWHTAASASLTRELAPRAIDDRASRVRSGLTMRRHPESRSRLAK